MAEFKEKYVRFDWAIKKLLRDKANYDILEGFLEVFLQIGKVKIKNILESEANQTNPDDKFNRVDIKAVDENGEIFIVEVQLTRYVYYIERILYGVSKAVVEQMSLGDDYGKIKKVYSISLVYYSLGVGEDYIYEAKTDFIGVHKKDILKLTFNEEKVVKELENPATIKIEDHDLIPISDIMPLYYIIRVNNFNSEVKTAMDEWMNFLKNNKIADDTSVPGLPRAKDVLSIDNMTPEERAKYLNHIESVRNEKEAILTARIEGRLEGRAEGIVEGRLEEKKSMARQMKTDGMPIDIIIKYTGLSKEAIEKL